MQHPTLAGTISVISPFVLYLPAEMLHASSYFMCYAGQVGAMWRELGEAMDQVAATPAIADRIIVAAHDAFRTLHRWRTQDLLRGSGIRYAV